MRVHDTFVIYFLVVHVVSGIRSISKPLHMFKCRDTTNNNKNVYIYSKLKNGTTNAYLSKRSTYMYIHIHSHQQSPFWTVFRIYVVNEMNISLLKRFFKPLIKNVKTLWHHAVRQLFAHRYGYFLFNSW